jgi:hypothetical protein
MLIQVTLICALTNIVGVSQCQIEDRDRRGFEELRPIFIDVDNDGKADTIVPRVYTVKVNQARRSRGKTSAKEIHWITFELTTSKGRVVKSFFRYSYGSDLADYWVYALIPCDKGNNRGLVIFYSGDDTSHETVVLQYRDGRFVVRSRKRSSDEF